MSFSTKFKVVRKRLKEIASFDSERIQRKRWVPEKSRCTRLVETQFRRRSEERPLRAHGGGRVPHTIPGRQAPALVAACWRRGFALVLSPVRGAHRR